MSAAVQLEREMAGVLRAGKLPSAGDFGGLEQVIADPGAVASSRFAAEFVELVLDQADRGIETRDRFVAEVVAALRDDFGIASLVDLLAGRPPLPDALERRCFKIWLALAADAAADASVRTAALRGALLMKGRSASRALQLAGQIAASDADDDATYLAHAARIGGYLHAENPDAGIVEFLESLLGVEGAAGEAHFELGMAEVASALKASEADAALSHLRSARCRFDASSSIRASRADAKVLSLAIGLLAEFSRSPTADMSGRVEDLRREAFAYSAYSDQAGDFLCGSRAAEIAAWASLAIRLDTLGDNLAKPAWLDAARIIEAELLAAYSASRTLFRRSSDGGLECLVRPRIERSIARNRAHLFVLREWLGANGDAELGEHAAELIRRTDAALLDDPDPDPPAAAADSPAVAAILSSGGLSYRRQQEIAAEVIAAAGALERDQLSPAMAEALAVISGAFAAVPEFATNPDVKGLVQAVAYKTLLFLEDRLDATAGADPTVKYLFIEDGAPDPLEKDLQQDFMRFLRTAKFGTVDEWRGIAGGRADIVHRMSGVRFVTEVKREADDASVERLLAAYGDQTGLYQTTNIPMGILLVLDLTTRNGISDHFKKLYRPVVGDLFRDGVTRGVLVVRVPARRVTPSAATVAAKKTPSSKAPSTASKRIKASRPARAMIAKAVERCPGRHSVVIDYRRSRGG